MISKFFPILSVALFSCTSNLPDYESKRKIAITEANQQLEAIREDIKVKYDSLSVEAKLNLVMIDFKFQYPKEYERLIDLPFGFHKKHLIEDAHFMTLCTKREVDTSVIKQYINLNKIESQP